MKNVIFALLMILSLTTQAQVKHSPLRGYNGIVCYQHTDSINVIVSVWGARPSLKSEIGEVAYYMFYNHTDKGTKAIVTKNGTIVIGTFTYKQYDKTMLVDFIFRRIVRIKS